MIEVRMDPKSMENKDTTEEISNNEIAPLIIAMNIEEDNNVEAFILVEKHTDKYNDNSFRLFVILPKTLKGALLSNWFDTILDNMIQTLINQSNKITDRDIEDLVTKYRIKESIEPEIKNKELHITEPIS